MTIMVEVMLKRMEVTKIDRGRRNSQCSMWSKNIALCASWSSHSGLNIVGPVTGVLLLMITIAHGLEIVLLKRIEETFSHS